MDAFVLGAVPPYSLLLGGKLVALLTSSDEVRAMFATRYGSTPSRIRQHSRPGCLAMITTTSALGRSSIYNRITYAGRRFFESVGFTRGSGEFHFANGLYAALRAHATRYCQPTAKHPGWGTGFRSRREVVKKCLPLLGLSTESLYHGVAREVFVVPLAENTREFLRGDEQELRQFHQPSLTLFSYFRERWLLPRAHRDTRYRSWASDNWRLWNSRSCP
jgi:hypothetical protein